MRPDHPPDDVRTDRATSRLPVSFIAALLVLGAVLFATVIPGVFSIDEDNYLVNVIAVR